MKRVPLIALLCACSLLLPQTASGLDCYTAVDLSVKEDCGMHTGCVKRFDPKTDRALHRGCFLTPGLNDTCDRLEGHCYCHTDLCNEATRHHPRSAVVAIVIPMLLMSFVN